jgi:hypothetical protein
MLFHFSRSVRSLFTVFICAVLSFMLSLTYAPSVSALAMNPAGDYVGDLRVPSYPRWQVVDPDPDGLKCRTVDPSRRLDFNMIGRSPKISKWAVLRTFKSGSELQGMAGNMSNTPVKIDDDRGKPWIAILVNEQEGECLVRANSQFVRPLLPANTDGWRCSCRAKDCGSREHPNSFTVEKTEKVDPSSSDYGCGPIVPDVASTFGLAEKMPYAEARQKLIDQGWMPHVKGTPPNLRDKTVKALFKQGYKEVKDCSGTGLGPCRFEFTNQAGEMLVVSTISQGQPGPDRFVWRWFIELGETEGSIGNAKG